MTWFASEEKEEVELPAKTAPKGRRPADEKMCHLLLHTAAGTARCTTLTRKEEVQVPSIIAFAGEAGQRASASCHVPLQALCRQGSGAAVARCRDRSAVARSLRAGEDGVWHEQARSECSISPGGRPGMRS
jgi:hypothetical protein